MRDSGIILRTALSDDGAGGVTSGVVSEIGPVLGQFRRLSGEEQIRAEEIGQRGRYRWAVPHDTAIDLTDQVRLLGVTYNVVWAPPAGALDTDRIVGLEEA